MQFKKTLSVFALAFLVISCKKDVNNGFRNPASAHSSEVASRWFETLTNITREKPYVPPQTLRILSYSGLALYESVVKGMPEHRSMYTHWTGDPIPSDDPENYYWPAVANAAVASIAPRLMEYYGPNPHTVVMQELEQTFNNQFLNSISEEQLNNSKTLGLLVADKIFEWSKGDGTLNPNGTLAACPPYTPLGTPGSWEPTPPPFLPAAGNCQGNLRTFIPGIAEDVLPAPPPAYSTAPQSQFYQAALQVFDMRNNLQYDDQMLANSWQDLVGTNFNTPAHVVHITSKLMQAGNINLAEAALLFSQQTMAISDAVAASFYSKFHYHLVRPVTYIRSVLNSPAWNSFVYTPQHPSYSSTMVVAAAAGFKVASLHLGENYQFSDDSHAQLYGSRSYTSFGQIINDVKTARTASGANFVFAADAAIQQGTAVAQRMFDLPWKK